jgi:hypothetical protein
MQKWPLLKPTANILVLLLRWQTEETMEEKGRVIAGISVPLTLLSILLLLAELALLELLALLLLESAADLTSAEYLHISSWAG